MCDSTQKRNFALRHINKHTVRVRQSESPGCSPIVAHDAARQRQFHPPMSYFLQHVAQDLRAHFADLSRVVVVFPNRRAGLFLNDYLVEDAPDDTPLWAPRYVTISELFRELSDVTLNDAVDSVCRLYAHYVDLLRSAGDTAADELSLDTFYG